MIYITLLTHTNQFFVQFLPGSNQGSYCICAYAYASLAHSDLPPVVPAQLTQGVILWSWTKHILKSSMVARAPNCYTWFTIPSGFHLLCMMLPCCICSLRQGTQPIWSCQATMACPRQWKEKEKGVFLWPFFEGCQRKKGHLVWQGFLVPIQYWLF